MFRLLFIVLLGYLAWHAFRLVVYILIGFLIWKFVGAIVTGVRVYFTLKKGMPRQDGKVIEEMVQDPACGSYVPAGHSISEKFNGERHFFCSEKCLDDYRARLSSQ